MLGCSWFAHGGADDAHIKRGVFANHAYGVLGTAEVSVAGRKSAARLIKLRNPHGRGGEFNGEWADGDAAWSSVDAAECARVGYVDADDGTFFMSLADWFALFEQLCICRPLMPTPCVPVRTAPAAPPARACALLMPPSPPRACAPSLASLVAAPPSLARRNLRYLSPFVCRCLLFRAHSFFVLLLLFFVSGICPQTGACGALTASSTATLAAPVSPPAPRETTSFKSTSTPVSSSCARSPSRLAALASGSTQACSSPLRRAAPLGSARAL